MGHEKRGLRTVPCIFLQNLVLLDHFRQIDTFTFKTSNAVLRENNMLVLWKPKRLAVIFDRRE